MSNATVSSQVYIVRNAGALAAVANGTMVIYADGTDLYAKDASNTVYNLTNPSGSVGATTLAALTDVTLASLTGNVNNVLHVLRYDANTSKWVNDDLEMRISDLLDVDTTGAVANQVLQFDGTDWVPASISVGSGISALYEASDVIDYNAGTAPTTGQGLVWNASNAQFELAGLVQDFSVTDGNNTFVVGDGNTLRVTAGLGLTSTATAASKQVQLSLSANLNDLGNCSVASAVTGQSLQYNGTAWVNSDLYINELFDVDTSSVAPVNGNVLKYNGTQWVPASSFDPLAATVSIGGASTTVINIGTESSTEINIGSADASTDIYIAGGGSGTDNLVIGGAGLETASFRSDQLTLLSNTWITDLPFQITADTSTLKTVVLGAAFAVSSTIISFPYYLASSYFTLMNSDGNNQWTTDVSTSSGLSLAFGIPSPFKAGANIESISDFTIYFSETGGTTVLTGKSFKVQVQVVMIQHNGSQQTILNYTSASRVAPVAGGVTGLSSITVSSSDLLAAKSTISTGFFAASYAVIARVYDIDSNLTITSKTITVTNVSLILGLKPKVV